MTSFFKNLKNNLYYNREHLIKENLISQLNNSVKEIQLEYKQRNEECLEQTDSTSELCTILEAIFLHGLKDSLLLQTLTVISGNDLDRKPEPNFWPLLLIFLHAHTIEQIEELTQIKTDIGNCRAWIRLSLNESLFSSYLNNIRKNSSALNPYYKNYAFLKDSEQIDIITKILEGFEASVKINLHVNSTLLNQWTILPLQLAGLYTPPLRSCPIASGIDVASSLTDDTEIIPIPKPLKTNEIFSNSISNSPFNQNISIPSTSNIQITENQSKENDLNEEENVQLFLEKIQEDNQDNNINFIHDSNEKIVSNYENSNIKKTISVQTQTMPNNNLINIFSSCWSDDLHIPSQIDSNQIHVCLNNCSSNEKETQTLDNLFEYPEKLSRSSSINSSMTSLKSPIDKYSYDALLIKHQKICGDGQVNMNDVWQHFENSLALTGETVKEIIKNENTDSCTYDNDVENMNSNNNSNQITDEDNYGFEILPKLTNEKFTLTELQNMLEHLCKLGRENGLDSQGYMCKGCAHPLGIGFANAHVCSFSGNYFCEQCMSYEQFIIPAKIIYNWDFRKYNVSKRAATFLTDFQYRPFIDLQMFNSKIYKASEEMAMIQSLRIQLNFIRAYMYTCCESSIQSLKQQLNSKEYLYKHIHQYSIDDLLMIPKGYLIRKLQKTYQFGEEHILNCNLCSVKGFMCEICRSPKVLYPFHIKTTFRCELCGSVFHDNCLDQSKPCPKCKRKQMRENDHLLEAIHLL